MDFTRRSLLNGALATGAAAALLPRPVAAEPDRVMASGAFAADLELLEHAYGTVHPGLARYLPPGGFAARVAQARRWAAQDRSLGEAFIMLARITAAVRCGHSYANPNNQRRAVRAALFEGRDRLPFTFRWVGGGMIVTGGRGGDSLLLPGSEVLALDGQDSARLLAEMLPLARADGSNDAKRIAQLGVAANERYAAFDLFRPLVAPARNDGSIRLRYLPPGGSARVIDVPARTEAELQAARPGADERLGWRFDIRADGLGLLTMPTWVTYNSSWDWKRFIDDSIDRLVGERGLGLVVDVRGNEGGTECGWHLLSRLVARDTTLPRFVKRVRYRRLPSSLAEALDTWDPGFRDWGSAAIGPDLDGFYLLRREDEDEATLRPRGRRFAGPVAVLTDAACSSATFQFANAVRSGKLATLIGEPTGGNRRGINGDAFFFVRLPGSGLEVDLPVVGMFSATPQPDAGVRPDIHVPVSAADIADGRDGPMIAALRYMADRSR